ncbi:hypothetical protein ACQHGV_15525 [Sphingomonas pseudosanguinis]|uniref:hypothetical protein n=1 Tax=Sphingomonas pseudosanguinis TaxID=413712 RepID=UPI003F85D98D
MSGRPIRFLGGVLGLWTLGRVAFLLPIGTSSVPTYHASKRPGAAKAAAAVAAPVATPVLAVRPRRAVPAPSSGLVPVTRSAALPSYQPPLEDWSDVSPRPQSWPDAIPALPVTPTSPSRWSASAWAILLQGGGGGLLPGGQLGGTQAGVRILRRIDREGALSASLRLSTPIEGIGREMAVGVDWRPSPHLPVRLLVEQRIALDRGQGGPAILAVAGFGPRDVLPGVTAAGYAQAGGVLRDRAEPFADGAVRATIALTRDIDLGLGAWGGAQRGAKRFDVGPTLGIALPVAGQRLRLSLDWRQRVAGSAAPGSGPALSIGGDF